MKLFVVFALIAVAATAPQGSYQDAQIIQYDNDNIGLGNYRFTYQQSDGQSHQQQGQLKNEGREDEYIAVKGQYSWVGPDSVKYIVNYVADDNGFQPTIEQGPGGGVPPGVVASLLG